MSVPGTSARGPLHHQRHLCRKLALENRMVTDAMAERLGPTLNQRGAVGGLMSLSEHSLQMPTYWQVQRRPALCNEGAFQAPALELVATGRMQ